MPAPSRLPPRTRSTLLAVVAALTALALGLSLAGPALADDTTSPTTPATTAPLAPVAPTAVADPDAQATAEAALAKAESFAAGDLVPLSTSLQRVPVVGRMLARAVPDDGRVDGTLVQRDLFRVADDLDGADQRRAQTLLARPTDREGDAYGDGYTTAARRTCSTHVCLHWVSSTRDAAKRSWVARTLRVMETVWRAEVGRLGYRRPVPDGRSGGDSRFDVYLKDLGSTGAYGYCTPESNGRTSRFTSSGYCVLDNDFSPRQYAGVAAGKSLRVTAAHEFFHAVQFAYDFGEDPWFMESTAVWMEEQIAGGINDNRQYLPFGQLVLPAKALDRFQSTGFSQYGNWVWWTYLSQRFGTGIVKRVWTAAAGGAGRKDLYSTEALRRVLASRGGFPAVFAAYAAATTDARRTYPEGRAWPPATTAGTQRVSAGSPRWSTRTAIDHMASDSYVLTPDPASLGAGAWALRVTVRGPGAKTSPAAYVRVVKTNGKVVARPLALNARGRGRTVVPFGAAKVREVTVTLANASTRFRCWRGSFSYSCQGKPRDDDEPFRLLVRATPR